MPNCLQRTKAIERFQTDASVAVFLLSCRSGAVGINLTAASHVFLMEPVLNPGIEVQAIGRAWRMGQTRNVSVKRFVVTGTVEERLVELARLRATATAGAPQTLLEEFELLFS